MSYAILPALDAQIRQGNSAPFTVAFSPDVKIATLEIWQNRELVAASAFIGQADYALPRGRYTAVLRFFGDIGLRGVLTITVPTKTPKTRSAKILQGYAFETISMELVL